MIFEQLKKNIEPREKNHFYCSDYGKNPYDLYFSLTNEEPTNPMKWNNFIRLGAGKGAEVELLEVLKDSEIVNRDYSQEENGRIEMPYKDIQVNGYVDAITCENKLGLEPNAPIEIKTINNANRFDIAKYEDGCPRDNYIGQLAMYMRHLQKDIGYLFVASLDGLHYYWFECRHLGNGLYKAGNTEIDLNKELDRFNVLYNENVLNKRTPTWDVRYKIPVKDIDWTKVSKTDISKARNGSKVIGDEGSWQIQYSNWKDKIIELQGETLGYTNEEISIIKELTKGYTKNV